VAMEFVSRARIALTVPAHRIVAANRAASVALGSVVAVRPVGRAVKILSTVAIRRVQRMVGLAILLGRRVRAAVMECVRPVRMAATARSTVLVRRWQIVTMATPVRWTIALAVFVLTIR
jgi:hypothetical protein